MSSEAVSLFLSKCHFLSFAYQYAHSTMTTSYTCSGKKKNAISYLGSQLSFFDKRSTRVFKFDTARGFMAKSHFPPSVARTHHLLWRSLLKRTAVPHRYRMHNSLCVHVCMLKSMILINWRLSLFPQTDTAWHCDFTAKHQNYIT